MDENIFIRVDDNKVVSEKSIRWIKKMDDCLALCTKSSGCYNIRDTHTLCKINNMDSYNRLNKYFIENLKN
jgi:hypothetical protein